MADEPDWESLSDEPPQPYSDAPPPQEPRQEPDWASLSDQPPRQYSDVPPPPEPRQEPPPPPPRREEARAQEEAPDWNSLFSQPPRQEEQSSGLGALARGAVRGAGGAAGALEGAAVGAGIGAAVPIVGPVIGGIGGALVGGFGGDVAWQALRDKLGIGDDPKQLEADKSQHPHLSTLGETAPYLATMGVGAVAPIVRVAGVGIMGAIDIAQQLFHTGTIDPVELGIRSLPGAMGGFNKAAMSVAEPLASVAGRALGADAAKVSEGFGRFGTAETPAEATAAAAEQPYRPGRPDESAGQTATENAVKAEAEVPNTALKAPGASATEPPPSKEELPTATLETERSERHYPKAGRIAENAGSPGVNEVEHADPAVEAALEQALGKKEPTPAVPEQPPAPAAPEQPPPPAPAAPQQPLAARPDLPTGVDAGPIPDFLQRRKPAPAPEAPPAAEPVAKPSELPAEPSELPAQPAQGIPFVMTGKMRRALADRGISEEQIRNMTPGQAQEHLAKPAAEPLIPSDVRNQLYKAGVPRDRVRAMTPEEAQRILSGEQTVEPAPATPKQQANALYQQAVDHVRNGGEATPEALQRELGVTPEQANTLAGRLEKAGLSAPPVRQSGESGGSSPSRNTGPEAQAEIKAAPAAEATSGETLPPEKPQPQSVGAAAAGARTFTPGQVAVAKSKLGEALNEFGPVRAFRTAFTPEHLTKDTATFENVVREGQSTTNRARLQYDRNMENLEKTINDHSSADHRNEFAATFQTGVPRSNPLSRFANDALDVERGYQARLKKVDPDGNFESNFLPKLFKNVDAAKDEVIGWKDQGRKGPFTIGDFLAEGHQLRPDVLRADGSIDPIRLQQRLNTGRDMFLESKSIVNKALDEGLLSHQQGPGMIRVEELSRGGQPIYAPPEVATMAKRYFEHGFEDPTDKSFWDTAQRVKNFGTMWQLMGGTYHMVAETTEAIIGDVQRAIQHAAAGDFGKAGKLLGQAAGAPIRQATSSARKALEAYYDPAKASSAVRAAVDHLVSGGLTAERVARYTPDINTAGRNFWEAWKKGALEMEFREKGARIGAAYERGLPAAAKQTSVEAFKFLGEAMQTVTHPMFNVYIPRLKIGAALEQMMDFMAANPNATARQHQDAAKRILKSIDDRLGELNQSTLFWNNTLKRGANLAMISPGWETGTLRAFLGGTKDLIANPRSISVASGADFRPNAAYPLAFAITTAAVGSIYQFLKTGQVPQTPHDAFFPKTGGTVKGQPEHAILPGYLKDVYSWWSMLAGEKGMLKSASTMAYNKLALVPHATWDTLANQDWAGKQIYNPSDPLQKKLGEYLGYVQRNMMPIAVQQLTRDQPKGSGISKAEAVVGLKKAPSEWKGQTAANNKAQKEADRFHKRLGY